MLLHMQPTYLYIIVSIGCLLLSSLLSQKLQPNALMLPGGLPSGLRAQFLVERVMGTSGLSEAVAGSQLRALIQTPATKPVM